ncbi:OPT family oligopeptide transporter [Ferrovibrio xuzhouensis]|uniref:OPT family oligopeptide transporter n=1 Tax=Ferrovibrio xuzhouensis TaxID=1576914 RepID=A0ABV7VDU7_9PROT
MAHADSHASPSAASLPTPELTIRAILTGMLIGAALTPCNVYSGLKIGWSFNMSIAAGLLGYGLWQLGGSRVGARPWGILENNINQTAASSAASIISGGLVAPIPALTLLTGRALAWHWLALWVFAVSILGVVVAAGLRNQMLLRERLAFPAGVATAETMTRIHGHGREALARLRVLLGAAGVSAALKLLNDLVVAVPRFGPAFGLSGKATLANLGFSLDPSLLMLGFGAIIGLRVGLSMLFGAVFGWGLLAPYVLAQGWAAAGDAAPQAAWFAPLVTWLLWPGVTLMVVAALVSFGLSLLRLWRDRTKDAPPTFPARGQVVALAVCTALIVAVSAALFDIPVWQGVVAVALSYVLAVVAARVSGETGITPVGALGKVTQLTYGVLSPGNVITNLMAANITGGAAGQCADLMHDLKTGLLIGATPRFQIIAQSFGVATGALAGSAVYLLLIPDPQDMLITAEWPAPAVATWKAVAEVLAGGLESVPPGALPAMGIAAAAGVILAVLERLLPERYARFVPSAPAIGLALVIPAWNAISLCLGALLAAAAKQLTPSLAERHTMALAAGLVAGESLAGVALVAAGLLG